MKNFQALPKDLSSTTQVRFQDCDPFGHLNNARYIDYFMNARTDHLASYYDFHIMEFGKQPVESWVVSKSQITYLSPAFLAEEVFIRTRLIRVTDKTLLVEGVMLDRAERRLKAVCWIEFTYVSLSTGKPVSHPDDLADFLSGVCFDETSASLNFDERVKELKAYYQRSKEIPEIINAATVSEQV